MRRTQTRGEIFQLVPNRSQNEGALQNAIVNQESEYVISDSAPAAHRFGCSKSVGQSERNEESGGHGEAENKEINEAAEEKLKDGEEPSLSIDAPNRQENLDRESSPEQANDPAK